MSEFARHTPPRDQNQTPARESKDSTSQGNECDSAQTNRQVQDPAFDWQSHATAHQSYQLLPSTFVQQQACRKAIQFWSAIIFILLALLSGLASSLWSRSHQASTIHAELITQSEPIYALQNDCVRLQEENEAACQWIDLVDSTKPDDSVLQVLLAIAESTSQSDSPIVVESIDIKLALEYPANDSRPKWAEPTLSVVTTLPIDKQSKTENSETLNKLTKSLVASQRSTEVRWRKTGDEADRVVLRIDGQPIATRVLP
jgi:hypothetical protein